MKASSARRAAVSLLVAAVAGTGITACSSSSSGAGGGGSKTYSIWDPYPQFNDSAAWVQQLKSCGKQAGVSIKRTSFDTTDLTTKALVAAQQGNSPDVLIVDNPVVSTLADAGALTDTKDNQIGTADIQPNLLGAGQINGKTYGVPIGANTLAIYYNKKVLAAAGVDAASITDWASLTAALAKVKAAGKKGITFSGIGTEEGSFQFLPWFWGSGAQLTDLSSSQSVSALQLWVDWLKRGYAPNSVINNTQTTSWAEFATGNYAFAENGTWQLANAAKAGFPYGIISIPARTGGSAPVPTGGEFVTLPVQSDKGRYATSKKIVTCLTSSSNAYSTDTALSYIAATKAVQDDQVSKNASLKPWVAAVAAAKGRTSDNLGTKYPKISEQLWKAVQAALSGSQSAKSALAAAQKAAAGATK